MRDLRSEVRGILEQAGFELMEVSIRYSFDFIAKKADRLLFVKVLQNIENLDQAQADDLAALSNELRAGILLVGTTSCGGPLKDGAVYERAQIPAVNPATLREILEGVDPLIRAARGGFYVQIDGDKLRHLRQDRALSLESFARKIGVSKKAVRDYEAGSAATFRSASEIENILDSAVAKPVNVFEVKARLCERNIPDFEKGIVHRLNVIGFEVAYAKKSPFNIVAKEEKEQIVSGLKGQHLKQKAEVLKRVGDLLEAEPVFILKKKRADEISGVPIIDLSLLKKIRHWEELLEKLK